MERVGDKMKIRFLLLFFWVIIGILYPIVWIYSLVCIAFNTKRAISIAVAFDRLGNAALGQGDRETISSWSGRKNGWQEECINWLFFHLTGEVNHCDRYRGM